MCACVKCVLLHGNLVLKMSFLKSITRCLLRCSVSNSREGPDGRLCSPAPHPKASPPGAPQCPRDVPLPPGRGGGSRGPSRACVVQTLKLRSRSHPRLLPRLPGPLRRCTEPRRVLCPLLLGPRTKGRQYPVQGPIRCPAPMWEQAGGCLPAGWPLLSRGLSFLFF